MIRKTIQDLLDSGRDVQNLLPENLGDLTLADAEYHSGARETWIEKNQVEAKRNSIFHNQVLAEIGAHCDLQTSILELGAGVGFDADAFMRRAYPFRCYIVSEISPDLLKYAKGEYASFEERPVVFCALDAVNMALESDQLDAVFMIAALHHFPYLDAALKEIDRVTKPNARIVFGVEPNRHWLSLVSILQPAVRALCQKSAHSAADEDADGFILSDFDRMAERTGWRLERVVPVWFLAGFLHQGLELLFRLFRLKKRIRIPVLLESLILFMDKLWFCLPFTNRFAWHYTAVFVKTSTTSS